MTHELFTVMDKLKEIKQQPVVAKAYVVFCNSQSYPKNSRMFVAVYSSEGIANIQASILNKNIIVEYGDPQDWSYFVEEVIVNRKIIPELM
jgi:hypothetical protein